MTICYEVAPGLLNEEMKNTLVPCRDLEWSAPSPERWREASKDAQRYNVRFLKALNYFHSPLVANCRPISSFGAYVMLNAIVQHMWRFPPDVCQLNADWSNFQNSLMALQKWQESWEDTCQDPASILASNASALLQVAHTRLHTNFFPVRSTLLTLNSEKISRSMKDFRVVVDRSNSSLQTARLCLQSLRTRVKLALTSKANGRTGFHLHLVSIECCECSKSS